MSSVYKTMLAKPELRAAFFSRSDEFYGDLNDPEVIAVLNALRKERVGVLASHVLNKEPLLSIEVDTEELQIRGIRDIQAIIDYLERPQAA